MKKISTVLLLPLVFSSKDYFRKDESQGQNHQGMGTTETGWPTFNGHLLGVGPVMKVDVDSEGHKTLHLYGDEPNEAKPEHFNGLGQTETGWPTINGKPLGVGPVMKPVIDSEGHRTLHFYGEEDDKPTSEQPKGLGKTETGWPTINGHPLGVGPVMKPVIDSEGHKTLHLYGEEDNKVTSEQPKGLGKTETGWPTINGHPLGVGPVMKPVVDSEGHKTLHLYGEEDSKPTSEQPNLRLAADNKDVFGSTETGWPTINGIPLGPGPIITDKIKKIDKSDSGEKKNDSKDDNKKAGSNVFGRTETGWPTINGHPLGVGPVRKDTSKSGSNIFGKTETGWPTINGKPLGIGPALKWEMDGKGHVHLHLRDEDSKSGKEKEQSSDKTSGNVFGTTETGWPTVNGVPFGVGPVVVDEDSKNENPGN